MQFIYEILSFNRILTVSLLAWFAHPSGRSSEKLPAHRPGKMHISRAIYRKSVR